MDSAAGAGGDGTFDRPWSSLSALSNLSFRPGDEVLLACGSRFAGGVAINESGTEAAPIVLKSYGTGAAPRFTNPRSEVLGGNGIRLNGEYIVVDGLCFETCPANPVAADVHTLGAVFLTTNANHCIVRNCEMTKTPAGITVYGQHNLITRNYIHDNEQAIQPHWGPMCVVICGSSNEVSFNRFVNYCAPSKEYGHDGGAIEINDRSLPKEGIQIHHNLSLRNQGFIEFVGRVKQDGFWIHHNVCMDYQQFLGLTGPCTNFRIEHNTVARTLAHPEDDSEDLMFWSYSHFGANTNLSFENNIFIWDGARVEPVFSRGEPAHSHNLFYRTDEPSIRQQPNRDAYQRKYLGGGAHLRTGDKIGDPLFRDFAHGDFHLRTGSQAIRAGTNLNYGLDFDGRAMPTNAAPCIGAFEFVPEP
ncbi:MAG TPA: chondroitinase-B domain-containing protein [Candidatus Dormibacteraeota bacterium]|nr:chondroitinase-B domain-containing protein [Candidatus Dormibacteraeota bacterium]